MPLFGSLFFAHAQVSEAVTLVPEWFANQSPVVASFRTARIVLTKPTKFEICTPDSTGKLGAFAVVLFPRLGDGALAASERAFALPLSSG